MFTVTARRITNGYLVTVIIPGVTTPTAYAQEQYVPDEESVAALLVELVKDQQKPKDTVDANANRVPVTRMPV